MNTISKLDSSCHKAAHVDLRDIWEETNTLAIPKLKPFQKDLKQSRNSKGGKNLPRASFSN